MFETYSGVSVYILSPFQIFGLIPNKFFPQEIKRKNASMKKKKSFLYWHIIQYINGVVYNHLHTT